MSWVAFLNHLPALPEAILLVGACALMIADTFVKDERRALTYWMAQGTLALCALATMFVRAPCRRRASTTSSTASSSPTSCLT